MAKDDVQSTVEVTEDPKSNKATGVIQLRMDNPNMTNVKVADKIGCSQTYSSKIWSDYMKSKGKTTKTRRKATNASVDSIKPQKITAKRKATTTATSITLSAEQILAAYDDMKCLVDRVGLYTAGHLLKRAAKESS